MKPITTYKDLVVWEKSMELACRIYEITGSFPDSEKFGLVKQLKKSAVSIPSNIAEGAGRRSSQEYIRFITISLGSLAELETQLLLSQKLGFYNLEKDDYQLTEIRVMLFGLIKKLKQLQKA